VEETDIVARTCLRMVKSGAGLELNRYLRPAFRGAANSILGRLR
jgi:hypothetical protein